MSAYLSETYVYNAERCNESTDIYQRKVRKDLWKGSCKDSARYGECPYA